MRPAGGAPKGVSRGDSSWPEQSKGRLAGRVAITLTVAGQVGKLKSMPHNEFCRLPRVGSEGALPSGVRARRQMPVQRPGPERAGP
jgi:hypothetical protein